MPPGITALAGAPDGQWAYPGGAMPVLQALNGAVFNQKCLSARASPCSCSVA